MGGASRTLAFIAIGVVASLGLTGCSDNGSSSGTGDGTVDRTQEDGTQPRSEDDAAPGYRGHAPTEITLPEVEGQGVNPPQPSPAVAEGYVQQEYFIAGTATGFEARSTPDDGTWEVTPESEEEYRTRVIVRRPADPSDFSGTVLVEWFNVSALEAAPDLAYLSDALARDGHAYVGVSAQAQGVMGGDTLLDVEVDDEDTETIEGSVDTNGLVNIDPERYGTLTHPGDAYSFDIYTQVGRALTDTPETLLGDLDPQQVIAVGESQSAMFLSTLVNAVHPLDPVFDGFLIHSRGSALPAIDGTYVRSREGEMDPEQFRRGVTIRTDLDVPVMIVEAETDLTVLGYVHARQPDTDLIRTWEIAGTAHADSETLRAVVGGPRDPMIGDLLKCGSVNSGPHKEVLRAALHHLIGWVDGGDAPPTGDRIEVTEGDRVAIVRDADGNAVGGVRNPLVDVPVATLSGDPASGGGLEELNSGGICVLFGQTIPFEPTELVERYGDFESYLEQFQEASDAAVASGFMLQPDADALLADIEPHRSLFP